MYNFRINNETVAVIDLENVVAIKAPRGADSVIVQYDGGRRGLRLPFNETAVAELRAAFSALHGGLVGNYAFNDPDQDDALNSVAHVRLDKVRGITRHHMDQSFVVVITTASKGLVLPFHPATFAAFMQAVYTVNETGVSA